MSDNIKDIAAAIAGRKGTGAKQKDPKAAKATDASATPPIRSKVVATGKAADSLNGTPSPAALREHRGLPAEVPQVDPRRKQRTEAQHRVMLDLVEDTIMRSLTDEKAAQELGIGTAELKRHQQAALDRFINNLQSQTTLHVYALYVLEQKSCMVELQNMINSYKTTNQHNAVVGAVKAKSEILDKIIGKGQDMGVIEKRAKRIEFIGSLDVRNMTELDIARQIMEQMKEINELVDEGIIDAELVDQPKAMTG